MNPLRSDAKIGSFSVNLTNGHWADFASDDKGGDLVSLYAYLFHAGDQGQAAVALAERFGITLPPLEKGRKRKAPPIAAPQCQAEPPITDTAPPPPSQAGTDEAGFD